METLRTGSADGRGGPDRRRARATRGRTLRQFIPPQHGAWAMLLLPWLAGVLAVGPRWPHLPLLGAWLAGYLFSYYLLQAIKTGRPGRVAPQLLAYGVPTALLGGLVLAMRPALLWYAPAYLALGAVNVWYARRRADRALVNDLAFVAQSSLMVLVCATAARTGTGAVRDELLAVAGYLTGTVLFVKTMIRERGSAGYHRASVAFHAAALVLAAWSGRPPVAGVFLLLFARALALPRHRVRPSFVGIVELAASCLLLTALTV